MDFLQIIKNIKISPKQIIFVAVIVVVIGGALVAFRLNLREAPGDEASIIVWGTDTKESFEGVIDEYESLRQGVEVEYEEFAEAGFEERVINALATGNGPDVFMVGNHDIPSKKHLLIPADPQAIPLASFGRVFPRVVAQDFIDDGSIYAVPLYLDTMVLFYNMDIFDQAGIAFPPATWDSLVSIVPQLRLEDASGNIERSAVAIGGSERNVRHAVDILNLVMMQKGVSMTNSENSDATFAETRAGQEALQFYLQFANISSPYYTWNTVQPESIEAFALGKAVMTFGYREDLKEIQERSPFLNVGTGSMPQFSLDNRIDYAKYKGLAVSRQSLVPNFAWDFAIFASTNQIAQREYLLEVGRPPALREYIDFNIQDPEFGIFAKQALTARSWYIADYDRIKEIFSNTINEVLTGRLTASEAIRQAEDFVTQLMRRRG